MNPDFFQDVRRLQAQANPFVEFFVGPAILSVDILAAHSLINIMNLASFCQNRKSLPNVHTMCVPCPGRPSLWLGHFGFNSGSALGANSRTAFRVVLLDAGSNMALTGSLHSSLLDQPGRPA